METSGGSGRKKAQLADLGGLLDWNAEGHLPLEMQFRTTCSLRVDLELRFQLQDCKKGVRSDLEAMLVLKMFGPCERFGKYVQTKAATKDTAQNANRKPATTISALKQQPSGERLGS
jgi:hypothetical protein